MKKKTKYKDDGRTIISMELKGSKWEKSSTEYLEKGERGALIAAAFRSYLPLLLSIIIGFATTALLIYLWLK